MSASEVPKYKVGDELIDTSMRHKGTYTVKSIEYKGKSYRGCFSDWGTKDSNYTREWNDKDMRKISKLEKVLK